MRLGTLLFAAFTTILVLCFSYPVAVIAQRLRFLYLESVEEPLVDTANVLAEIVGEAAERGPLDIDAMYATAARVGARDVSARIYEMLKARVDVDVYVTDAAGKLVFDSRGRRQLGADYARWRDVSLTLAGQYGARVSSNPKDPSLPRLLYVAAPIRAHGRIAGVLTVVKPTTAVSTFLRAVRPRLLALGIAAVGSAITLALLVSLWLTHQVRGLTRYAQDVRAGRRVPFPRLAPTELREMGVAFEKMRESLAGQTYIEQYVRALTHEIKSPISAIRGAAEILDGTNLPEQQRARLLSNIQDETHRIQDLVDRMLELSELEVRRALPKREPILLAPLLRTILEAQAPQQLQKALQVELELPEALSVRGDGFLLHLALSNLVKNALEFSPVGGCVRIRGERADAAVRLYVQDEGPGIPEYAKPRIFERFYSLARPDTGRKSTGLGLNFVKEIVALHHGCVALENRPEGGLTARVTIPAQGSGSTRAPKTAPA